MSAFPDELPEGLANPGDITSRIAETRQVESKYRHSVCCCRVTQPRREVTHAALRHRIVLNFEGEAEGIETAAVIEQALDAVARI